MTDRYAGTYTRRASARGDPADVEVIRPFWGELLFLLVSGASGVGKTTARLHARHLFERRGLGDRYETAELFTLGPIPDVPTVAWRHERVEQAVRRAIALEAEGRHLLFAGDPVPLGEVLAAPSADRIDIAGCLLDIDAPAHLERMALRHEPEELIGRHREFAGWLRAHATDPGHVPEAITDDGWDRMRWSRWVNRESSPQWRMEVVDTSRLAPEEVGVRVAAWSERAVAGAAPVFRAGWFRA